MTNQAIDRVGFAKKGDEGVKLLPDACVVVRKVFKLIKGYLVSVLSCSWLRNMDGYIFKL